MRELRERLSSQGIDGGNEVVASGCLQVPESDDGDDGVFGRETRSMRSCRSMLECCVEEGPGYPLGLSLVKGAGRGFHMLAGTLNDSNRPLGQS
jgi:hypothetical protein